MSRTNPLVDKYISQAAEFAKPILGKIRSAVHANCPEVEETLKWGFPHFVYHGILCSMAAFKSHCAFGFWKGSQIVGLAAPEAEGMGQFGRLRSGADLPSAAQLRRYIRAAMALNETDTARTPRQTSPQRLKIPEFFKARLTHDASAASTFSQLSRSQQREYVEWVTQAKQAATREKRLKTTLEWLSDGKPMNWKYGAKKASKRGAPARARTRVEPRVRRSV